jgi:hypothetical protein
MLCKIHRAAWASIAVLAFAGLGSAASAAAVCPYVPALDIKPQPKEVTIDPKVIDAAAGFYKVEDYDLLNVVTVARDGARLSAQFAGQPAETLLPESNRRFFYPQGDSSISLDIDGAGRVKGLVLHRNHLKDLPLTRIDGAKAAALRAKLSKRIDPLTGAPRSRPALLHLLDDIKSGHLDSKTSIQLEIAFDRHVTQTRAFLNDLGPVQSVKFLGFMDTGLLGVPGDTYDVFHQNGVSRWHIAVDDNNVMTSVETHCGP